MRHTTAMHLLQSGNELNVIKAWLGHADFTTTHAYVEIDMKMKLKALDACQPPPAQRSLARWLQPDILDWLQQLSQRSQIMLRAQPKTSPMRRNLTPCCT